MGKEEGGGWGRRKEGGGEGGRGGMRKEEEKEEGEEKGGEEELRCHKNGDTRHNSSPNKRPSWRCPNCSRDSNSPLNQQNGEMSAQDDRQPPPSIT